jgi:hypothetical protein
VMPATSVDRPARWQPRLIGSRSRWRSRLHGGTIVRTLLGREVIVTAVGGLSVSGLCSSCRLSASP